MTGISLLRKAKPVNVREAQAKLSQLIRSKSPFMIVSHGKPVSFLVPYEEMLDVVEIVDELKDRKLLEEIWRARHEAIMRNGNLSRRNDSSEIWASSPDFS